MQAKLARNRTMTNKTAQHRKLKRLARDTCNIEYKTQNNDKQNNTEN